MRKKALVVGSIGYDYVFNIHGKIRDKVLLKDGKIDKMDLLFTANELQKRFGGTAGNIAYGLAKLGHRPLMYSIVGSDYSTDYAPYLKNLGVLDRSLNLQDKHTATFYAISDEDKELIGVWQPNAHESIDEYDLLPALRKSDLAKIALAIFSPGKSASIAKHMQELKQIAPHIKTIFDPGQIINFFDPEDMEVSIAHADMVVGNEVEIPILEKTYGYSIADLLNKHDIEFVIETKGAQGAELHSHSGSQKIKGHKAKSYVEATGAGDAFRAGMLAGLLEGEDIVEAISNYAVKTGSAAVGVSGGQGWELD